MTTTCSPSALHRSDTVCRRTQDALSAVCCCFVAMLCLADTVTDTVFFLRVEQKPTPVGMGSYAFLHCVGMSKFQSYTPQKKIHVKWPTYILSTLEGSARYRCLLTGHLLTCACQRCAAPLRQYNTVNCDLAVGAQCVGIGPDGNRHL
jgi:hypothetical protein